MSLTNEAIYMYTCISPAHYNVSVAVLLLQHRLLISCDAVAMPAAARFVMLYMY